MPNRHTCTCSSDPHIWRVPKSITHFSLKVQFCDRPQRRQRARAGTSCKMGMETESVSWQCELDDARSGRGKLWVDFTMTDSERLEVRCWCKPLPSPRLLPLPLLWPRVAGRLHRALSLPLSLPLCEPVQVDPTKSIAATCDSYFDQQPQWGRSCILMDRMLTMCFPVAIL